MSIFDQIKADHEAGTAGKWLDEVIYGWGDTPCVRVDGVKKPFVNFIRPDDFYTQYVTNEDGDTILSEARARAAGNYVPTPEHRASVIASQAADARRIARVPQLEAAILALEAVLGELDKAACVERRGVAHLIRERIEEAAK